MQCLPNMTNYAVSELTCNPAFNPMLPLLRNPDDSDLVLK